MPSVKLENVSFNKLKEFISLGNKKNITIKGKFTLLGEYDVITKDRGGDMTLKQLNKKMDTIEEMLKMIIYRLDKLENLVIKEFTKHGWIKE